MWKKTLFIFLIILNIFAIFYLMMGVLNYEVLGYTGISNCPDKGIRAIDIIKTTKGVNVGDMVAYKSPDGNLMHRLILKGNNIYLLQGDIFKNYAYRRANKSKIDIRTKEQIIGKLAYSINIKDCPEFMENISIKELEDYEKSLYE